MKEYQYIIWDWNGTLLDDVSVSVNVNSEMLIKRGLPPITKEQYLEIIEIPLIKYYAKLFDLEKDPFDKLSLEFIEKYEQEVYNIGLMDGAQEILDTFHNKGIKQVIISSFEETILRDLVAKYGVSKYFDEVIGRNDFASESKTGTALQWVMNNKVDTDKTIVIGDLTHDYEMSKAIKADCVLIANGHHSKAVLMSTGVKVIEDIRELHELIK